MYRMRDDDRIVCHLIGGGIWMRWPNENGKLLDKAQLSRSRLPIKSKNHTPVMTLVEVLPPDGHGDRTVLV